MTRLVNNQINSMVQVMNSSGDKVTEAIVNYKVYRSNDDEEVWESFDSGLMEHIGDGIYTVSWTPDKTGEFTFYAYSTNPKFHESYTYYVENNEANGGFAFYGNTNFNAAPPTQDLTVPLIDQLNGFKGYFFRFWQSNNENADKQIEIDLQTDNSSGTYLGTCPSGHMMYLYYDQWYGMWKFYDQDDAEGPPFMMGPTMYDSTNKILVTNPIECKHFKADIRFGDSPGTNQVLQVYFSHANGDIFLQHHDPPED
jgi:hypothetical protein